MGDGVSRDCVCVRCECKRLPPVVQERLDEQALAIGELQAEEGRIAAVIERAGVSIPRESRPLHDWLAQVLQVLAGRDWVAEMERDQARRTRDLAQAAANRSLMEKREAEHRLRAAESQLAHLKEIVDRFYEHEVEPPAVRPASTEPQWRKPDWVCARCESVNFGIRSKCRICGLTR